MEFNAVALQNAPTFQNSFISPRTRNEVTPGLKAEKIWGVDASYNLSYRGIKARLSGYYTMIHDQTDIISYYDDLQSTFVNFAISGIDKKFFVKSDVHEKIRMSIIGVIMVAVCMSLSFIGISNIITYAYGYDGYLALAAIVLPVLIIGNKKNKKFIKEHPEAIDKSY